MPFSTWAFRLHVVIFRSSSRFSRVSPRVSVENVRDPAHDASGALEGVSFRQWRAYRETTIRYNREESALSRDVFLKGLQRIDEIAAAAEERAALPIFPDDDDIDRAERDLSLGLNFLEVRTAIPNMQPDASWLSGGFAVTGETASEDEPEQVAPKPINAAKMWRIELDD